MKVHLGIVSLLCAGAVALAAAQAPAARQGGAAGGAQQVHGTLVQVMRGVLFPASNVVFTAQDDPATGDSSAYWWDFDHRLVKVQKQDGTVVEHTYDADGVRVQTKTTKAGVTSVQNYLVDTSGALSHVVAETDEAGALKALYVRGDDLLAVIRASGTKYVHADGLGSVVRATDASGVAVSSRRYEAFGSVELGATNGYAFTGREVGCGGGTLLLQSSLLRPNHRPIPR